MLRIGKSAGDLEGIRTFNTIKLLSSKQIYSNPYAFNLASYSSKRHLETTQQTSPQESLSTETLLIDTLTIIKHFYIKLNIQFVKNVHQHIKNYLESKDKNFQLQINKLFYLRESMYKKSYDEIEVYVLQEWKKNGLLSFIRRMWIYDMEGKGQNGGLDSKKLKEEYDMFRECVGQLIMIYFGQFFIGSGNNRQKIIFKMISKTSHLIITHSSQWQKLYKQTICPLLSIQPKSHKLIIQPSLKQLQFSSQQKQKSFITNIPSQIQKPKFVKTINKIEKFIKEHKIFDKIKHLLNVRRSLEEQIKDIQQKMIEIGFLKKYKILDKDDFIDCLLQCIIIGKIQVNELQIAIQYVKFMCNGNQTSNLLNYYQCEAYLADLQAVKNYIIINMAIGEDNE